MNYPRMFLMAVFSWSKPQNCVLLRLYVIQFLTYNAFYSIRKYFLRVLISVQNLTLWHIAASA